jgi:hypothetical protein
MIGASAVPSGSEVLVGLWRGAQDMALVSDTREQWIAVIDDYLTVAEMICGGGCRQGYSAVLLLLCAIDAMGNGLLAEKPRKWCRLDVLAESPFDVKLTGDQIQNLTEWYRHLLVHTGTMAVGVDLVSERQGAPFDFDAKTALTRIRVPVLYEAVKRAWKQCDKTSFKLRSQSMAMPDLSASLTIATQPASGVVTVDRVQPTREEP